MVRIYQGCVFFRQPPPLPLNDFKLKSFPIQCLILHTVYANWKRSCFTSLKNKITLEFKTFQLKVRKNLIENLQLKVRKNLLKTLSVYTLNNCINVYQIKKS